MFGHTQYVVRVFLLPNAVLVDWRSVDLEQVPRSNLYHKSAICHMQLVLLSTWGASQHSSCHHCPLLVELPIARASSPSISPRRCIAY